MTLKKIIAQSEKEFDRINNGNYCCNACDGYNCKGVSPKVKQFLTQKILEAILEEIEGMNNHNEMAEMEGIKYTEGFEKALSDLRDKIKSEIR